MTRRLELVTWNVNSIRARGEQVLSWLSERKPDLVALQELKVVDEAFPFELFEAAGYDAQVYGQKTYNGVAFLVKKEGPALEDLRRSLPELEGDEQARVISGLYAGVRVINLYVPNGSEVGSEKYAYKLDWLQKLARHLEERHDASEALALLGDFNIAPDERDVHDPIGMAEQVLFSPRERAALARLLDWGLVDVFRDFHEEAGLYSWWDYRAAAFRRKKGARIDLVLVTEPLRARVRGAEIDVEPRGKPKPSDHAPVIVTIETEG